MNNYRKWAMMLFLGLLSSASALAEKPKMATVDMQQLFREYHRTVTAQKHFNAEYAKIQKSVDEKGAIIQRMTTALNTINIALQKEGISAEDKKAKQREGQLIFQEIKIAQRNIEVYGQKQREVLAHKKAASMQGIMTDIRKQVVSLSEKIGYDYVFDRSGLNTNQTSFFLYLKDATEITSTMLKELNKFAPGADSQ